MSTEPIGTTVEDQDMLARNVAAMTDADVEAYLYDDLASLQDAIDLADYTGELMDERGLR